MKKFLVVLLVFVNGLLFSQVEYGSFDENTQKYLNGQYGSIDDNTQKYLNQFGIFYIGSHYRYLVTSGEVENLNGGSETTARIKQEYAQFIKWKPENFKLLPEPIQVLTFKTYFYGKILEEDTEFAVGFCGTDHFKIVNYAQCEVNNVKLNVKSIDIIEVYMGSGNDSAYGVFIFFTNYEGITELLTF
jgi:hypothetical protein